MAEIKIEKKKPVWSWILLILIVLGLIWFFYMRNTNDRVIEDETGVQLADTMDMNYDNTDTYSSLDLYSSFIADSAKMGVDHEYSSDALNHLIDAVEEKGFILNVDINADLDEARKKTAEITKDPNSLNHADLIKSTGKIIARALSTLQTSKFPNLTDDMARVNTSVDKIDTSVKTLDQKGKINDFFKSAESLLIKMQ